MYYLLGKRNMAIYVIIIAFSKGNYKSSFSSRFFKPEIVVPFPIDIIWHFRKLGKYDQFIAKHRINYKIQERVNYWFLSFIIHLNRMKKKEIPFLQVDRQCLSWQKRSTNARKYFDRCSELFTGTTNSLYDEKNERKQHFEEKEQTITVTYFFQDHIEVPAFLFNFFNFVNGFMSSWS